MAFRRRQRECRRKAAAAGPSLCGTMPATVDLFHYQTGRDRDRMLAVSRPAHPDARIAMIMAFC